MPAGLLGRFGVVKLWPDIKVAEDEVIARLRNTARALGLECVVVDHLGCTIDPPHLRMTQTDLDFVIHLHFGTPKSYDIFSFVVLWNPLQFYHDFGYRRVSRHLLTHDDFLSCGSATADDQVRRMIARDPTREGPRFTMYHSASEPVLAPTLGDCKLFYSGINWERLGRTASRHQEVLDEIDLTGKMRIYGPRVLRGVKVWDGYRSYQGSIPFDGSSMMREINRAGIALVLSSEAHVDAALMSNRLFEALAGGAVVVCDQNPFARKHFGDALLYVDMNEPADEIAERILGHIRWVEDNPEAALELARRAQAIFQQQFQLDLSLREIYSGFSARRDHLLRLGSAGDEKPPVTLFLLMPAYDAAVLERQVANAVSQSYAGCRPVLVVDAFDLKHFRPQIEAAIAAGDVDIAIRAVNFFDRDSRGNPRKRVRLGGMVAELLAASPEQNDLFCVVAPNEELHANHVHWLAAALARCPDAGHAYSDQLLRSRDAAGEIVCDVQEKLDLPGFTGDKPIGCCRFLLRRSALGSLAGLVLPYLDLAAFVAIGLYTKGAPTWRATNVVHVEAGFNVGENGFSGLQGRTFEVRLREEHDVVRDFDPDAFDRAWQAHSPVGPAVPPPVEDLMPSTLYLDKLTRKNRQVLLTQMLQSLPIPGFVWRLLRPLRPWRREAGKDGALPQIPPR